MKATKAKRKDPAAVSLGRRGGKARLKTMTKEQRSELARNAVLARWARKSPKGE
jgi:hypothetical protein